MHTHKGHTMRRLIMPAMLSLILLDAVAYGQTLEWDRNTEPDMRDYRIWACDQPGCVPVKSSAALKATVPQPAAGKNPSWLIPSTLLGKPGAIAISARDKSLNESALSAQLQFDTTPPAVPTNPRWK
jgi:hypothetical protein